jgi:hypothetical protein
MKAVMPIPRQGAPNVALLLELAGKHIWWKTPEEALEFPSRIIAQVMNRGDFNDITAIIKEFGEDYLRQIVINAEAGQFNERSWHYWHYRLGLASPNQVPALPTRYIP